MKAKDAVIGRQATAGLPEKAYNTPGTVANAGTTAETVHVTRHYYSQASTHTD
jgi:hypothetical protein